MSLLNVTVRVIRFLSFRSAFIRVPLRFVSGFVFFNCRISLRLAWSRFLLLLVGGEKSFLGGGDQVGLRDDAVRIIVENPIVALAVLRMHWLLDENMPAGQRLLLREWRIHFRVVGIEVGPSGTKYDNLIPWLHRLFASARFDAKPRGAFAKMG